MLMQLIYASRATRPLSEQDLLSMLQAARRRNQQYQITGMLVYRAPLFLQVLEAEEQELARVWEFIKADPRHTDIVEIRHAPAAARDFPDWSMGFANLSHMDLSAIPGYSHFLDADFSLETMRVKPGLALAFLLDLKYCELP